jgi:group II intron reverse transcriptase/maturase
MWHQIMGMGVAWILDVDIKSYFDTLDHSQLRGFLDRRVRDGVVRRLIDKWLKAGVMEEGKIHYPEEGTPQGGVISPLLSNIYLHYVLDTWFQDFVRPRMKGKAFLIRYADDFVLGFQQEEDALRVQQVLPKRFSRFGLTIHSEKTRRVPFQRPRNGGGTSGCGTFTFLGFLHYWSRSRKGTWVVKRKTASNRFARSLKRITTWLQKNRTQSVEDQHHGLTIRLRGVYNAWGITGNYPSLSKLRHQAERLWLKWWNRRGGQPQSWTDFQRRILNRLPLPSPRLVHSVVARP